MLEEKILQKSPLLWKYQYRFEINLQINEVLLLCRGRGRQNLNTCNYNLATWLLLWGGGDTGPCPTPDTGYTQRNRDADYEDLHSREGRAYLPWSWASLGELMLGCNIGWTRRGVPFWEGNRSHDMMVPSLAVISSGTIVTAWLYICTFQFDN